jgi:hypothetical protein
VTSPAARAAVYLVFGTRWIARWTLGAALGAIALGLVYVLVVLIHSAEPWYDREVMERLAGGPADGLTRDASDRAAEVFPDGMTRAAAVSLLHANGFSCSEIADAARARLTCRREPHLILCAGTYTVELGFNHDGRVADRKASVYAVCV